MARSKPVSGPRTGNPVFRVIPHKLSIDAQRSLARLAGIRDNENAQEAMLSAIAYQLGRYHELEQALDNAPRASDHANACKVLIKRCDVLLTEIGGLNPVFRENLVARLFGVPTAAEIDLAKNEKLLDFNLVLNSSDGVEEAAREVTRLRDAAMSLLSDANPQPSDGASTRDARLQTIANLQAIFEAHYKGPATPATKRGAFTIASEKDKRERKFIEYALEQLGISLSDEVLQKDLKAIGRRRNNSPQIP